MNKQKIFLFSMCMFYIAFAAGANPYDDLAKGLSSKVDLEGKRVAVTSFETDEDESTGRAVAEELTEAFTRAGIGVVERENMDRIYEEQKLQLSGVVSNESGAEIGEAVGASYIVLGTIREVQKPGYSNAGLKIQARMVDVGTNDVASSASTTVEKTDLTSPYRRREVQGAAEYPALLSIRLGGNLYTRYLKVNDEEVDENDGLGLEVGLGYTGGSTGFLARGWEFLYGRKKREAGSADVKSQLFTLGRSYLVRLPLWRYWEALPYLSHAYLGANGAGTVSYNYGDFDDYWGIHAKAALLGGYCMGITDAVSLFAEYRYNFKIFNIGWGGFGAEETGVESFQLRGHQLHAGISLAP